MIGFLIALISGALMSLQGVFNTNITKQTGPWLTNSFVQLTGFLVCFLIWFFLERKETKWVELAGVSNKYMLVGGILGAMITWTVILSMGKLGPAKAIFLIVFAQIVLAYLIEVFGWFGVEKATFQWTKLLAIAIMIGGIGLFQWDKK